MFNISVATWATALKNRGPDKNLRALGYRAPVKFFPCKLTNISYIGTLFIVQIILDSI